MMMPCHAITMPIKYLCYGTSPLQRATYNDEDREEIGAVRIDRQVVPHPMDELARLAAGFGR